MENEQLIHDYTNGRLSREDTSAFEARLTTNPELAREVKEYKDLKKAIKENERLELKTTLQELEVEEDVPEITNEEKVSFTKKYRHIYIAAAVIIFAIIGFQFLEKEPSGQDLYASYYQPYDNTLQPVTRGETGEDVLSQAFQAYEAGEFKKAITLFDSSLKKQSNPDVSFYKAMSLISTGSEKEAATLLNNLKKEKISYKPQLYWYSALLALKNNDKQTANEQLDSLSMLNSDYKKSAIINIKKELND